MTPTPADATSPVLVVGAGPVGLVAAIRLRQQGIAVRIIDEHTAEDKRTYPVLLHPRVCRRLDVGAKLAENAPQPLVVRTQQGQADSALSTLLLAQLLPRISGTGTGHMNGHTPSA